MGNMNLVTGYRGAEHVTADDHGSLYAGIFGEDSFVLARGSRFAATAISSNKINIADGDLVMQGRHGRIAPGIAVSVTIENCAQGYKRHDLIVARYSKNASTLVEEMSLTVIKGTATTGTAADPAYTDGDILNKKAETADFPLYRVVLNGVNIEEIEQLFSVFIPATLGADGTLSVGSIPSLGYIPTSQKGAANGVAPLDESAKVPASRLPISSSIASAGKDRIPTCAVTAELNGYIGDVEWIATQAKNTATTALNKANEAPPHTVWIEYSIGSEWVETGGYDKIKAAVDGGNFDVKLKDSSYGYIMFLVEASDSGFVFMGNYRRLYYVEIAPGDICTEKHPLSED